MPRPPHRPGRIRQVLRAHPRRPGQEGSRAGPLHIGTVQATGGGEPLYYLVATLGFESSESMAAGLASPEMAAAGADVANFAAGGATMLRAPETVLVG